MMKNKITLAAICLVLLIAPVYASASAEVAHNSANPLFSVLGILLPDSPPQTVRVRLTVVETNADVVDWPYPDIEISIKAGTTFLNKKSDEKGIVVFDAVPCGAQIVITAKGTDDPESEGVFHRNLICTGRQVDLGVVDRGFGGKFRLKQRRLQRMGYDPTKNVWRDANGKIISMRTFNQIMARRK